MLCLLYWYPKRSRKSVEHLRMQSSSVWSYTGSESYSSPLSSKKSLGLVRDITKSSWSKCCFSFAWYFPGICEAAGDKAATPCILGICFDKISLFLYSVVKSAANTFPKYIRGDSYRTILICRYKIVACEGPCFLTFQLAN